MDRCALTVSNAVYNPETGIVRFTAKNHGLVAPESCKLRGIGVICAYGAKTYPNDKTGFFFKVRSVGTTTSFETFVGVSTLQHDYTGGGVVQVGVTSNLFPSFDEAYPIAGIVSARTFEVNVDLTQLDILMFKVVRLLNGILYLMVLDIELD